MAYLELVAATNGADIRKSGLSFCSGRIFGFGFARHVHRHVPDHSEPLRCVYEKVK